MSLTSSLSIATQSLFNASAEIENSNNNIANANTPGYTREVVELRSIAASWSGGTPQAGGGANLVGFQSVRDELLQRQIQAETQTKGQADAEVSAMAQVQPLFATSSQDIGTEMSALFSNLSTLSTSPQSTSAREGVLAAAQNLADAFNSVSGSLSQQQNGLNSQVTADVSQINALSSQIAALNPQIATAQSQGKDPGALEDQRDQLVQSLSKLVGISQTQTEDGITLTTTNGTPLVVGNTANALQTTTGTDGMQHVLDSNGNDITSNLSGGDLGGVISVRDTSIPQLQNNLDTLANQFATAFNAMQTKGFDQNGNPGGPLFTVPATVAGSAASIKVAITNPSLIAASSDGSAGSNGNVQAMLDLQSAALPSGKSPVDAYAAIVYSAGNMASQAQATSSATTSSLLQLNSQLASVSGVSIDEESANLVQWQQSYEAAARVITTVQSLFQVTMQMGT